MHHVVALLSISKIVPTRIKQSRKGETEGKNSRFSLPEGVKKRVIRQPLLFAVVHDLGEMAIAIP